MTLGARKLLGAPGLTTRSKEATRKDSSDDSGQTPDSRPLGDQTLQATPDRPHSSRRGSRLRRRAERGSGEARLTGWDPRDHARGRDRGGRPTGETFGGDEMLASVVTR